MELMKASGDAFDGVAFQCYSGGVGRQSDFRKAYPTKVGPYLSWKTTNSDTLIRKYILANALVFKARIGGMISK